MKNEQLEPEKEKRYHRRSGCKGKLKWSYFNKSNSFNGELLNFGPEGLYFETSKNVRIGATIFIQLTKYFPERLTPREKDLLRNVCLGKVIHCEERIKQDSTCYGVGVECFSKLI
jgi:hypothetical protein